MESAVLPCLPMTLPKSLRAARSSRRLTPIVSAPRAVENGWLTLFGPSQEYTVTGVQGDDLPTFLSELVELIDLTGSGKT